MRQITLAVVLTTMGTSNAWADTCTSLPRVWQVTPSIVRMSVVNGLNKMYEASTVPHDADTLIIHGCMLSKVDFFVDSIIMHCNMGTPNAEQVAFNAMLNLCAKELGYD